MRKATKCWTLLDDRTGKDLNLISWFWVRRSFKLLMISMRLLVAEMGRKGKESDVSHKNFYRDKALGDDCDWSVQSFYSDFKSSRLNLRKWKSLDSEWQPGTVTNVWTQTTAEDNADELKRKKVFSYVVLVLHWTINKPRRWPSQLTDKQSKKRNSEQRF